MLKISQPEPSHSKNAKSTICIFGEKNKIQIVDLSHDTLTENLCSVSQHGA